MMPLLNKNLRQYVVSKEKGNIQKQLLEVGRRYVGGFNFSTDKTQCAKSNWPYKTRILVIFLVIFANVDVLLTNRLFHKLGSCMSSGKEFPVINFAVGVEYMHNGATKTD